MNRGEDVEKTYLQMTFGIEEQILRFNVPVSDTLTVKIGDSVEYLLETTFGLAGTHSSVNNNNN